jgi:hypothetical protein
MHNFQFSRLHQVNVMPSMRSICGMRNLKFHVHRHEVQPVSHGSYQTENKFLVQPQLMDQYGHEQHFFCNIWLLRPHLCRQIFQWHCHCQRLSVMARISRAIAEIMCFFVENWSVPKNTNLCHKTLR